jgi:acyl-CoA thioesterase-2
LCRPHKPNEECAYPGNWDNGSTWKHNEHRSGGPVTDRDRDLDDSEQEARQFVRQCTPIAVATDAFEFDDGGTGHMRSFGGLQMAQALAAAAATIDGFIPHSLHTLFLRRVAPDKQVRYEIERVRDGRNFATRRVRALQEGRIAGDTVVSFTRAEDGLTYDGTMPVVPPPEGCREYEGWEGEMPPEARRRMRGPRPVEQRLALRSNPEHDALPAVSVWMRPPAALPDDTVISASYLAYISDMATVAVPSRHQPAGAYRGTSLDHKLHLHHLPRIDGWLLFARESPRSAGGRALVHGALYTQDGVRVASCVQEALLWKTGDRPDPWARELEQTGRDRRRAAD